jgi:exodeoxyribonuclease VII small subunit
MAKSFEEAMKELGDIVEKLEDGDVSLEESIKLFENGMKLSKTCQKMLENAEKKVSVLTANEDGEMQQEPFAEKE